MSGLWLGSVLFLGSEKTQFGLYVFGKLWVNFNFTDSHNHSHMNPFSFSMAALAAVEQCGDGAELGAGDHPGEQLEAVLEHQRHAIALAQALSTQVVRQLVWCHTAHS